MTSKADFTDEEWTLLREAPTSAGMLVVQADKGGMFRETFSMGKAYTEARKQHGASHLLDDIVSEKPKVDRAHTSSQEELRANLLQHIRDAIALLGGKGTPEEVEEYRRFMLGLANRVAEAHREGGEEPVSDAERQTIAEIAGDAPCGTRMSSSRSSIENRRSPPGVRYACTSPRSDQLRMELVLTPM
jgi:hypothetical protein